jgi:hypothetical protein
MSENEKTTALVVHTANDLNTALLKHRDQAHILTPFTQTMFEDDIFAPGFKPSLRMLYIDPDEKHGEVYPSWEKPGNSAITKMGLDKLAQLAGIEWVHVYRVDDTMDPCKATYYAEGRMRLVDGTFHKVSASKSSDLNKGTPEALQMKPKQLDAARKNLAAITESKAKNRVIRSLLGIASSFSPEELKKPFLVMKIVPDMNDPEVKRMVQAQMLGLEKHLFASRPDPEPSPGVVTPGTTGLDLPEPPESKQLSPGTPPPPPIDIIPEPQTPEKAPEQIRVEKIQEISLYYETKTIDGKRDPSKPKLEELTDDQLDRIIAEFKKRPDIRTKQDLI